MVPSSRGAPGAVARLQRGEADTDQNTLDKMEIPYASLLHQRQKWTWFVHIMAQTRAGNVAGHVYHREFILSRALLDFIGFATLEPSHSSRRSLIPHHPKKIKIGTRDQSENSPECTLHPDFHPLVVKITKSHFGGIWGRARSQNRLWKRPAGIPGDPQKSVR